jgi:UDP-2,3-diacylglucosamine pyrophosphatase LpxH
MRTLILSDIHLGSRHCNHSLIAEVLEREAFDRLILNGDTIHNVNFRKFTKPHWALLDRFRKLARERELILIRGNHDHEIDFIHYQKSQSLTTGHILPALLEVPMREEYRLEVQGQNYLVLHGDRFDPTMRYPVVTEVAFMAYQFTTKFSKKLAKWLKKKSKRWGGILEIVRGQSVRFAQNENYPGVITGHTHFAEDVLVDDIHYVNTGSWTESPCAYVTLDHDGLELHHVAD